LELEYGVVDQACTTQKARRAKLSTYICCGPQKSVLFRCRDFIVVWTKFYNENFLFEVELLQHFLQLKKALADRKKAFTGRMQPAGRILSGLL